MKNNIIEKQSLIKNKENQTKKDQNLDSKNEIQTKLIILEKSKFILETQLSELKLAYDESKKTITRSIK